MIAEQRIRVRNGDRVIHAEYGAGVVTEFDAEHGLGTVKFRTDDGILKAVELTDRKLSLDTCHKESIEPVAVDSIA